MTNFKENLKQQITFLETSLINFNANEYEAIRIATTIRVLVHDTTRSTSLLTHLGIKKKLKFIESKASKDSFSFFNIQGKLRVDVEINDFLKYTPYTGLVAKDIIKKEGEENILMKYKPIFKHKSDPDKFSKVDFRNWWDSVVYDNRNGYKVTRKNLVLTAFLG